MNVSGTARLHVVTGKGGTGKTTMASALALALAAEGSRVLLVEVEERQGIAQALDTAPLATDERRIASGLGGGRVMGLEVRAREALMEYLQSAYRLGAAGRVLERVGAVDFATTVAPGVRDVLLIGKVFEAVRRREGERPGRGAGLRKDPKRAAVPMAYDHVVLDAPPTGRIGRFLDVTSAVTDLARVGPIHSHASKITTLLRSPETVVHLTTVLEQMPVQETVEAVEELRGLGLRVGAVLVTQVEDPQVRELPSLEEVLGETQRVGFGLEDDVARALLREGADAVERGHLQDEQRQVLLDLDLPVLEIPRLDHAVGREAIGSLAWAIAPHLGAPAPARVAADDASGVRS